LQKPIDIKRMRSDHAQSSVRKYLEPRGTHRSPDNHRIGRKTGPFSPAHASIPYVPGHDRKITSLIRMPSGSVLIRTFN
jgi:hypothetical protein